MADFIQRYGQWGFVAGAAEGIGAAFCEELARNGMNVIMADVKADEMQSLAGRIESAFTVQAIRLVVDLSRPHASALCMEAIAAHRCRLLIYNAAYSRVKPFLSSESRELDLYVDVNARTPLKLVHSFSSFLKENKYKGSILLMSSLAGFWGTGLVAAYSGTKSFNLTLGEALYNELKPLEIEVSVCCAGATATPGYLGTNPGKGIFNPPVMDPKRVAAIALRDLGKRAVIIPGLMNRLSYFILARLLPRRLAAKLMNKAMAATYRDRIK